MDSLEIIDQLMDLNKKYDPDFCVFEKGSITNSILPMLNVRMLEHNNYVTIHTINPAVDKVTRAQSIRARMRSGQVKFDKSVEPEAMERGRTETMVRLLDRLDEREKLEN